MGKIEYTKDDIKRTHELAKIFGWGVTSISLEQAAEALNYGRRTIYNRIRDKRLNTKYVGSSQRVILDDFFYSELHGNKFQYKSATYERDKK